VSSDGKVYTAVDWSHNNSDEYNTTIFGFTVGGTKGAGYNELVYDSSNTITDQDFEGEDQDCTAFGIDANDNLYSNGYGNAITKIAPDGTHLWSTFQDSGNYWYGASWTAGGETLWVGERGEGLVVTKLDTAGNALWSYTIGIEGQTLQLASFGEGNSVNASTTIKGDSLVILAGINAMVVYPMVLFKLGLEPITGTYGPFTFTDITGDINFIPVITTDPGVDVTNIIAAQLYYYTAEYYSPPVEQSTEKITIG
jgi:hypothetical protein